MVKLNKNDIIKKLSENLSMFFPDFREYFMCPTCLAKLPIRDKDKISEAHIIPKIAGGTIKTLLCTDCNNFFGSNQDKWFGELIRIANSDRPSVFSTNIKEGYFIIDEHRINGYWKIDDKGNFKFYWDVKRNPPHINKLMQQKLLSHPPRLKLKVPFPVLRENHQIKVGFLTAGYLMFFAMFGYSWVLQSHLDPIRKQIRNPQEDIIRSNYIASTNILKKKPWIGFMKILKYQVPIFGFLKNFVLYPPMYKPDFYSNLGEFEQNIDISNICVVKFKDKPEYNKRLIVLMEDKVMIAPDSTKLGAEHIDVIQFMYGDNIVHTFRPVDKEDFRILQSNPLSKTISIRLRSQGESGESSRD